MSLALHYARRRRLRRRWLKMAPIVLVGLVVVSMASLFVYLMLLQTARI